MISIRFRTGENSAFYKPLIIKSLIFKATLSLSKSYRITL